ncbi:hypothetical protein MBLNU457_6224t2 [Dothideomycetes sp. NU457]
MPAPSSNGSSSASSPGVSTFTSRNKQWRISTRKLPILKAEPIEAFNKRLGIPVPEMIFGDNSVRIEHPSSGFSLDFNAFDALDRVSKTSDGMLQVAYSKEWQADRQHQEGIKEVVKPFDWSYSTDYRGTTTTGGDEGVSGWRASDPAKTPIRTDLLTRPDPILFYDDVVLYEDELADNGIALLSCKIRVMPERLLLLSRFFLRLDGVIVRVRDTRVYIELGSNVVIRQYTAKEESYEKVQAQLAARRENVPEAFRDANRIAPLLRTVEETMDCFEVPG